MAIIVSMVYVIGGPVLAIVVLISIIIIIITTSAVCISKGVISVEILISGWTGPKVISVIII